MGKSTTSIAMASSSQTVNVYQRVSRPVSLTKCQASLEADPLFTGSVRWIWEISWCCFKIEGRKKVPDHVPSRDGSEAIFPSISVHPLPGCFFHSCLVSFGKCREWREQNIDLWNLNMIQCFRLKPTFSHIFSYQSPPTNMAATLSGYWKFHHLVGFSHISWEFPSHVTLLEGKGSKPNSCVKYMLLLMVNYHYSNYWGIIFQNSFGSTTKTMVKYQFRKKNCSGTAAWSPGVSHGRGPSERPAGLHQWWILHREKA